MNRQLVYTDNAATTRISDRAMNAMLECYKNSYGNPSSIYSIGNEAEVILEKSREKIAELLGCTAREVYFTSGGSESDNWAIKGTARRQATRGKKHIITTQVEHHAVLHSCQALEKEGFSVTYLPVDEYGRVAAEQVANAIQEDTALVTIMYANNEIGTIMPIAEIGKVCREKKVLFHTDAVQAIGHMRLNFAEENVDMLSLSAHKFHGPKGVGCLIIRKGFMPMSIIDGGAQERGYRAGTENVAQIVGMTEALTEALENLDAVDAHLKKLSSRLTEGILKLPYTRLNGHPTNRLSGNVNISIEGIEGEALLLSLDAVGICGSSGSACTSGSLDPSHVLLAIGLPHEIAHGSLRLSLSTYNTEEDVNIILKELPIIVSRLRSMSPVWEDMMEKEKNLAK